MPNGNLKVKTICPQCKIKREVRGDVVRKAEREGKLLHCRPCKAKLQWSQKPHPKKGTGVINDPDLEYTRRSFYKAKRRCKLGKEHHLCYEGVEFKIASLAELVAAIGLRPKNQTLDRIDTNGNYEIGNVRWATRKQQAQNRNLRGTWT
jgi:hypothetical protein